MVFYDKLPYNENIVIIITIIALQYNLILPFELSLPFNIQLNNWKKKCA